MFEKLFERITLDSWTTAEHFLANAPDGCKLSYSGSWNNQQLLPRISKHNLNKGYLYQTIENYNEQHSDKPLHQISHSFIKLAGEIFAIEQGTVLGNGHYGKVKLIMDKNNNYAVIKITSKKNDYPLEGWFLQDINYSLGKYELIASTYSQDKNAPKTVMHLAYQGVDLYKYLLANPNLADKQRLNIAKKLFLAIFDLHITRNQSQSKFACVHRDIKLENITYNVVQDRVSLIDFGFVEQFPRNYSSNTCGSFLYLPTTYALSQGLRMDKLDVIAALRVCYLPSKGYFYGGYASVLNHEINKKTSSKIPGLLGKQWLHEKKILNYFNTAKDVFNSKKSINSFGDASFYAALLIVIELELNLDFDLLKKDVNKQYTLIASQALQINKESLVIILNSTEQQKNIAAFTEMGLLSQMKTFLQDKNFDNMIKEHSRETVCCLIHLKIHQLDQFYQNIVENKLLSNALYALLQSTIDITSKINTEVLISNVKVAKAVSYFNDKHWQRNFNILFDQRFIENTYNLDMLLNRNHADILELLIKNKIATGANLAAVFNISEVVKAIFLLNKKQMQSYFVLLFQLIPHLNNNFSLLLNSERWDDIKQTFALNEQAKFINFEYVFFFSNLELYEYKRIINLCLVKLHLIPLLFTHPATQKELIELINIINSVTDMGKNSSLLKNLRVSIFQLIDLEGLLQILNNNCILHAFKATIISFVNLRSLVKNYENLYMLLQYDITEEEVQKLDLIVLLKNHEDAQEIFSSSEISNKNKEILVRALYNIRHEFNENPQMTSLYKGKYGLFKTYNVVGGMNDGVDSLYGHISL